jgi:hypothetical protein
VTDDRVHGTPPAARALRELDPVRGFDGAIQRVPRALQQPLQAGERPPVDGAPVGLRRDRGCAEVGGGVALQPFDDDEVVR